MKSNAAVSVALALAGFSSAALGGDLGGNSARGVPLAAKVDQDINRAVSSDTTTSPADIDSRIKDLESTRAAIDQKRPPKVSLSVSGWVDQEFQYNVKQ